MARINDFSFFQCFDTEVCDRNVICIKKTYTQRFSFRTDKEEKQGRFGLPKLIGKTALSCLVFFYISRREDF